MTKKIFIISATALLVALFFLTIYNLVFKKDNPNDGKSLTQDKEENTSLFKNNKGEKGAVIQVAEDQILRAVLVRDTERIRYYAVNGMVWEIESDGSGKNQISAQQLAGIQDVLWSPDGTKVITTFVNNEKKEFYTYDYQVKKSIKLKDNLDNVVWDGIGAKIIYKYFDPNTKQRTINVANPDGSGWKTIADSSFKDLNIASIPQSSVVSMWNAPSADEETTLLTVGISGGEVQKIFSGKFSADYLWSRDGNVALVSSLEARNGKQLMLGIIDRNGTYSKLDIPTFVSKCVWSADNKTVYYALPAGMPEGNILPDDYLNRKFYSSDTFWKIDVKTGKKERLAELEDIKGQFDASRLFLSDGETELFFINRVDRKLYKIAI